MNNYFIPQTVLERVQENVATLPENMRSLAGFNLDGVSGVVIEQGTFEHLFSNTEDYNLTPTIYEGMLQLTIKEKSSRRNRTRSPTPTAEPVRRSVGEEMLSRQEGMLHNLKELYGNVSYPDNPFDTIEPRNEGEGLRVIIGPPIYPNYNRNQPVPRVYSRNYLIERHTTYLRRPSYYGQSVFIDNESNTALAEGFTTPQGGADLFILVSPSIREVLGERELKDVIDEMCRVSFDLWNQEIRYARAHRSMNRDQRIQAAKENFMTFGRRIETRRQEGTQNKLLEKVESQQNLRRQYQENAMQAENLQQIIQAIKTELETFPVAMRDNLQKIADHPRITNISVTRNELCLDTDDIRMEDPESGDIYAMGRYQISIRDDTLDIGFQKLSGATVEGMIHPYIHDRLQDTSGISLALTQMLARKDIFGAFNLVLAFLETLDPDHPWSMHAQKWPKVDQ